MEAGVYNVFFVRSVPGVLLTKKTLSITL